MRPCPSSPTVNSSIFGINERFAAANGNHRGVAFRGGSQAILQRHHVLEAGGIFADAPATGASEIAGVQRFKLQHQSELWRPQHLMLNDMGGDFRRQREWKSHSFLIQ